MTPVPEFLPTSHAVMVRLPGNRNPGKRDKCAPPEHLRKQVEKHTEVICLETFLYFSR